MTHGILTAGGGQGWETSLVAALDRPGATLSVVRRCADVTDLVATASSGQAQACVVSADLRHLDMQALDRLAGLGLAVVVVRRASDNDAVTRFDRMGVRQTVADDVEPAELIASVAHAIAQGVRQPDAAVHRATADPVWAWDTGRPARAEPDVQVADEPPGGRHHADNFRERSPSAVLGAKGRSSVVAVWGPGGAPGRTTVAMGIAEQVAASGQSVLLIDGDVYGGLLASAYGLLDESPGLAGACRLAANGRLDADQLTALCWKVSDRFALLTGIARADRWPEVRPSAIPVVLELARDLVDLVVVDCAAQLEADEELTFDTMAPRRNGATLALLDDADLTIAVGSADPPGIERLIRGLAELSEAIDGAAPHVVLNRVRKSAASKAELIDALQRFAGVEPVALLPDDRAACDAAWRAGVPLGAAAPKSALTSAIHGLALRISPVVVGAVR